MGQLLERTTATHTLLCITTLIACCGACVMPLAPTLATLCAAGYILDFGLGGVNCAGNTLCAWANSANPTPALSVLNGKPKRWLFYRRLLQPPLHRVNCK
jgi:hypothetical protein